MSETPHWKDTKEQILSQGIDEDELEEAVEKFEDKFGGAIKTKDFLYYMVATHEYGISLPRISSLGGGQRGETKKISAKDVSFNMAKSAEDNNEYFTIDGWVFDTMEGTTSNNNPKLSARIIDDEGTTMVRAYGQNAIRNWDSQISEVPCFVILDGVQAFARKSDEDDDRPDFFTLTFGQYADAEVVNDPPYDLMDAIPDASEEYVEHGQVAKLSGFVTDEDRNQYDACTECGKSFGDDRVCPRCGNSESEHAEFHRLTIMKGGPRDTLELPPNLAPHENIYGSWVESICRRTGDEGVYRAMEVDVGSREYDPPEETFSNGDEADEEEPEATGTPEDESSSDAVEADESVTRIADEVITRFLKPYGKNPRESLVKIMVDEGLEEEQAEQHLDRILEEEDSVTEDNGVFVWED